MNRDREYWNKKFPVSERCHYCNNPITRENSQRVMRIKDAPGLPDDTLYILEDICLKCLPSVRANVLAKKGGASIIDHNTKTVVSSNPRHVKELLDKGKSE